MTSSAPTRCTRPRTRRPTTQKPTHHDWLGNPRSDASDLKIVSPDWVQAALDLWETHGKAGVGFPVHGGLDPADGGDDCVYSRRQGPVLMAQRVLSQPRGKLGNALDMVADDMGTHDGAVLYYDDGAVVGSDVSAWALQTRPPWKVWPVPFGGPALGPNVRYGQLSNKALFRLANVQMGWNLRDRFRTAWRIREGDETAPVRRAIVINPAAVDGRNGSPSFATYAEQITQPEYKRVEGGRITIDKAPRGLSSPDHFDADCLAYRADVERGLTPPGTRTKPQARQRSLPRGF